MRSNLIFQEVNFCPRGEANITLEGEIAASSDHLPHGVILCHPHPRFGGDMYYPLIRILAEKIAEAGLVTLRFNFRGVGMSRGSYDGGEGETRDVLGGFDYLQGQESFPISEVSVVGYSFGAWVGLRAAEQEKMKKAVGICLPVGLFDFGFIQNIKSPLLIIQGTNDQFASLETARHLIKGLSIPARLEVVAGGDHFLWGREEEVARLIVPFLKEA